MDPSPMPASRRRDHDSGRVAVPEIAELLHLQRPAAAVAASAVVLVALLLTLVAPSVLPANVLTGTVVGLLAVIAAIAVAVVLDGRDPVLRGPRHLRRDGHAVLARMAGPGAVRHGAPVLTALERRLDGRGHHSVVLTGTGADPSALAVALGRGAAADGHTALVIDLRAHVAPGVADVGAGTVRLGEAAQLADDRPYAWIGAGVDRDAAAEAAAAVARRPPRDLEVLLVVAPEAVTHVPQVLQACERTLVLVDADTQQRTMVTARMDALRRAGGRPEAVVVGGLRVAERDGDAIGPDAPRTGGPDAPRTDGADRAPRGPAGEPASDTSDTSDEPAASDPETEPVVPPSPEPPPGPEPPPTVPEPTEPEEPEPAPAPEPGPDSPPIVVPDPQGASSSPDGDGDGDRDAEDDADEDAAGRASAPAQQLEDTGPIRPITFRTAGTGDTAVEGMADDDPLTTAAALEQLLARQHRDRA